MSTYGNRGPDRGPSSGGRPPRRDGRPPRHGPPHRGGPRRGGDPRGPRHVPLLEPAEGEIESILLDARGIAEDGNILAALARAGEAVRLGPDRPEGYLVLGELLTEFGDFVEAMQAFEAASSKAAAAGEAARDVRAQAAAGTGRARRLSGDLAGAVAAYRVALGEAPEGVFAFGPEAAETFLLGGDFASALRVLAADDDALPDEHFVAAICLRGAGDLLGATARLRSALFGNLYLLAALLGEDPPDLGLRHGLEEARPAYAVDAAARLAPVIAADETVLDWVASTASTPTVAADVGAFVDAARRLMTEPVSAERARLTADLDRLRNPARLRETTPQALIEASDDGFAV